VTAALVKTARMGAPDLIFRRTRVSAKIQVVANPVLAGITEIESSIKIRGGDHCAGVSLPNPFHQLLKTGAAAIAEDAHPVYFGAQPHRQGKGGGHQQQG